MPPRRTLTGKVPKQRGNPYLEHNCFPLDGFPALGGQAAYLSDQQEREPWSQVLVVRQPERVLLIGMLVTHSDFFIWHDELEDKGYTGPALLYGYAGVDNDDGYGLGDDYADRYLEEEAGLYLDECLGGGGGAAAPRQLRTPPGSNQNSPQKKKKSGGDGNKKVNSTSKKRKLQDDDDDDVQVVGSSSSQKKKKPIRLRNSTAARSPSSSESPSPTPRPSSSSSSSVHKLQTELARLRAELEHEKADKNKFKNELDELRDENSQMLEQLFPGPFSLYRLLLVKISRAVSMP
ncbi:hypothetical protein RHOSPDRAFT_24070 [Rhodotorula sp. JG-1b]|nr:hypothetical protein RHOSPDRAFT_24070 [Rhodotorula sp. JG-1b]